MILLDLLQSPPPQKRRRRKRNPPLKSNTIPGISYIIQVGKTSQIVQKQLGCPVGAVSSLPGTGLALDPARGLGCFGASLVVADSVSEHMDVILLPLELFCQLKLLSVQLMEPLPELPRLLRQLLLAQVVNVERLAAIHQRL